MSSHLFKVFPDLPYDRKIELYLFLGDPAIGKKRGVTVNIGMSRSDYADSGSAYLDEVDLDALILALVEAKVQIASGEGLPDGDDVDG